MGVCTQCYEELTKKKCLFHSHNQIQERRGGTKVHAQPNGNAIIYELMGYGILMNELRSHWFSADFFCCVHWYISCESEKFAYTDKREYGIVGYRIACTHATHS